MRTFPAVDQAQKQPTQAAERLESLRRSGADRREVRTAECDWFGAELGLKLAEKAATGGLREAIASVMPAEITLMRIGPWAFVGWPGEAFVEFSLKVKASHPNCYVISLANSQLEGYLVTEEAVRQGWYEALNSVVRQSSSRGMLLGGEDAGIARAVIEAACGFASSWSETWQRYSTIDLGTTYFKISLFDRNGRLCDTCRIAPPIVAPRDGYMELPADAFGNVIARGIAELRSRAGGDLSDVEAVTFATQTNSFVLLDAEDRPLTPLILWPDRRAEQLEEEVRRRCDIPGFSATTGIPRIELPVHGGEAALAAKAIARNMEAGEQAVSDQRLPDAASDGQARDGSRARQG